MPKCPNCERELSENANFCDKCGASLQSPAIAQMIEDARQTLFSNPDDVSARYNMAIAYKLGGMDDLALQEFSRVAELQPDYADVHYEMGLLHAKSGRTEEAVGALNRALELDPNHRRANRLLERLQGAG